MSDDAVWDALARALTGEYEIVARLGIGTSGAPVYLARELVTDNLVAIRLPPLVSGNESQEYGLEVVRQIDGSLPEIDGRCPHCSAKVALVTVLHALRQGHLRHRAVGDAVARRPPRPRPPSGFREV
jgi:hypothetical protein